MTPFTSPRGRSQQGTLILKVGHAFVLGCQQPHERPSSRTLRVPRRRPVVRGFTPVVESKKRSALLNDHQLTSLIPKATL